LSQSNNTKGGGRGTGMGTCDKLGVGQPINPSKVHIATNTQLHPTHLSSKRDKGATTSSHTPHVDSTHLLHSTPTPTSPICPTPHVDSTPQIGSKDPSDGRIWICPGPTKT
jgi:hypothetical protein